MLVLDLVGGNGEVVHGLRGRVLTGVREMIDPPRRRDGQVPRALPAC